MYVCMYVCSDELSWTYLGEVHLLLERRRTFQLLQDRLFIVTIPKVSGRHYGHRQTGRQTSEAVCLAFSFENGSGCKGRSRSIV
jgi:hypothetical protein